MATIRAMSVWISSMIFMAVAILSKQDKEHKPLGDWRGWSGTKFLLASASLPFPQPGLRYRLLNSPRQLSCHRKSCEGASCLTGGPWQEL